MIRRGLLAFLLLYLAGAAAWVVASGFTQRSDDVTLLNVACDPTRELWRELNARFIEQYERDTGRRLKISQSHAGSGSQARAVIDGLQADVVTLALWSDTDAIRQAGLIEDAWEDRLPHRSLPYTSTIVFVVRKGNPKGIRDWQHLERDDVSVITPNPKTSGNGKWSVLAMWGSVVRRGGSEPDAVRYLTKVFKNVPVLDASARGATMTFAHRSKLGDVHLTWENEAYLEVAEANGELEIVYPSLSIRAEPHVAVVDAVARRKGTAALAKQYLEFCYRDEAQRIIASHYYRPIRPEFNTILPPLTTFNVSDLGLTWAEIHSKFFAEGALFDAILAGKEAP